MNKIVRNYIMEDEDVLVKAEVTANILSLDLGLFTAKFPFINPAFVTSFQGSIDTANAFKLDSSIVADIKVLTADVNNKVLEGHAALKTLGAYAQFAYMNNDARQTVFGQSTWTAAKSDQEKMMNALELANEKALTEPYKTDLNAKGYSIAEISNLMTISNAIRSLNLLQESAKEERPVTTQDRVVLYNSVWEQLRMLNIASKVVFVDNPAKLQQYMLYPNSESPSKVRVLVLDKESQMPKENVLVGIANTELEQKTTDASGLVEFSSTTIPDIIEISLWFENETVIYENLSVAPGLLNEYQMTIPK